MRKITFKEELYFITEGKPYEILFEDANSIVFRDDQGDITSTSTLDSSIDKIIDEPQVVFAWDDVVADKKEVTLLVDLGARDIDGYRYVCQNDRGDYLFYKNIGSTVKESEVLKRITKLQKELDELKKVIELTEEDY